MAKQPPNASATATVQGPGTPGNPLKIECKNKKRGNGKKWTQCDYKQFCAKIAAVNEQIKNGDLKKGYTKRNKTKKEKAKKAAQAKHRRAWKKAKKDGKLSEKKMKKQFYDECAYNQAKNEGALDDMSGFEPDHIHEVQLGGPVEGPFLWCRNYVNGSLGSNLKKLKVTGKKPHTEVQADCCPAA